MDKIDKESKDVETAPDEGVDLQRWVIKHCPFCGNKETRYIFVTRIWKIECKKCRASIQFQDSKQQAITAWNQRDL